jgi:hypothetical protein
MIAKIVSKTGVELGLIEITNDVVTSLTEGVNIKHGSAFNINLEVDTEEIEDGAMKNHCDYCDFRDCTECEDNTNTKKFEAIKRLVDDNPGAGRCTPYSKVWNMLIDIIKE